MSSGSGSPLLDEVEVVWEEALMQALALKQEESAKRSFQTMMRRKVIQEEAQRKSEERRMAILDQQEETEYRLMEHEQKKERYLDFKRELDGLRCKNKEINVERQRRREEAERENVAEAVKKKDEKIDHLNAERQRMWNLRKAAQSEAYRAREAVKMEIMKQRIESKFNSKKLESKLGTLMASDMFSAKILHKFVKASNTRPTPARIAMTPCKGSNPEQYCTLTWPPTQAQVSLQPARPGAAEAAAQGPEQEAGAGREDEGR